MKKILSLFWDGERLRAFLRLFIQITVVMVLYFVLDKMAWAMAGEKPPLSSESPLWSLVVRASLMLVPTLMGTWLVAKLVDRRRFSEYGFRFKRSWWIDCAFGFILGVALIAVVFLIEYSMGWVTVTATFHSLKGPDMFVPAFGIFIFLFFAVSVREELVSRGYMLTNLAEGLNFKSVGPRKAIVIAWVISSVAFGIFHIDNPNATLVSTINISLAGIFLGIGFVLTGELAIPIGVHLSWNLFQGNVFGFPVSGITIPANVVTFIQTQQAGPDLWTGGPFGPEAGLMGLVAMTLGTIATLVWVKVRYGKLTLFENLAIWTPGNPPSEGTESARETNP